MAWTCLNADCGLPDPDHDEGDGTHTCRCDRCYWCSQGPGVCDCEDDGDTRTRDNDWAKEMA